MPSFIRPTYKIVMEEFSSWRPCLGCFHSSRRSSPTADIKDRNLRKRLQKFCRISTLKSSNAPIGSAGLWSCPNAGSSSAPSHGSIAADGSPRIGRTSTERRSRSCASHQSASCSENSAIRPELSGQTLSADVLSVLGDSVQDRIFPGAVAALISSTDEIYIPFGRETYDPIARPISDESIFDVASLTKLATTTAIMQLVERKQLALHDQAFNFVPQLRRVPKDQ